MQQANKTYHCVRKENKNRKCGGEKRKLGKKWVGVGETKDRERGERERGREEKKSEKKKREKEDFFYFFLFIYSSDGASNGRIVAGAPSHVVNFLTCSFCVLSE